MHTPETISRIPVQELQHALDIDPDGSLAVTTSLAPPEKKVQRGGSPNWMSADKLKTELEASDYTTEQRDDCVWLLNHARRNAVPTWAALAETIGYPHDETILSRVMKGKYPGSRDKIDQFFARVAGFRQLLLDQRQYGGEPVVETSVITEIRKICDLTRSSCTISLIHGKNQTGKTLGLTTYRDHNNHGRTIYVRMRVGAGRTAFSHDLCSACGISVKNNFNEQRDRIIGYFDSQTLLIVDEMHQAFLGKLRLATIEFIREIHDLSKCGVVLCGTEVFVNALGDLKHKEFLGQLANRGIARLYVPTRPKRSDLAAVMGAYGLDAPHGEARRIVEAIAAEQGIGRVTKYLRMARAVAMKKQEEISWDYFMATHATFERSARGTALIDEEAA